MSLRSFAVIWEGSEAKGSALLLLLAIGEHFNTEEGFAWPSIDRLCKYSRIDSPRTVQKHLKTLEDLGEIRVHTGGGARNPNRYYINLKKLEATGKERRRDLNPASFAGFEESEAEKNPAISGKKPRNSESEPRNLRPRNDMEPRNSGSKTPQSQAPNCGGRLRTIKTIKEGGGSAGARTASPESPPSLPSGFEFVEEGLAEIFPNAIRPMPERERALAAGMEEIFENLTPDDWEALTCWFVHADDQARGRKKWPRTREEFLANASEAIEKIREWWKAHGAVWWAKKVLKTKKREERANDEQEASNEPKMSPKEMLAFLNEKGGKQ